MVKKIVIVGGGQASFSCASRLRDLGFEDEIVILCEEAMYPYQRPPLSKKFLIGQFPEERLLLRKYEYFEEKKINVLLNKKALRIDRQKNKVYLETGEMVQYSKLVLATGSRAKKNPMLENDKYRNVFYLRNLSDAKALQHFLIPRKKILVVGGGYLGLEVAAICSSVGIKTTLVEGKDRILKRVAGNPTASHLRKLFVSNGVRIIESDTIEKVYSVGREISVVTLNSGKKIDLNAN